MQDEAGAIFQDILTYVPRRRWAKLERDYRARCEAASGRRVARAISATDTAAYEAAMAQSLAAALRRAVLRKTPAVYVEYDPYNKWSSFFSLLRRRDTGRDLDWLQDTKEYWEGPAFAPFARLWPPSQSDRGQAAAAAYLAARTMATFGRACGRLDSHGITIYFARHDDYDSIVPVIPGGRPDYGSISERERRATLRAEDAVRAQEAAERLGSRVGSDEERHALRALAKAGATIGTYPDTASGIDYVYLERTRAGDDVLAHVARLRMLRALTLDRTRISDNGLRHLAGLRRLQSLSLDHTRITDAGLSHLKPLAGLKNLGLAGTAISDAGLVGLRSLRRLKTVTLYDTAVTQKGVSRLLKALPRAEVIWFGD